MSAVEPLISKLAKASNKKEKLDAILNLGNLQNEKALETLIQVLSTEKDNQIKSHAADAIIKIGSKKAVNLSLRLLSNDSWITRMKAAEILGEIGDTKAVRALIRVLRFEEEASVREWAAIGLGKIKDKRAFKSLSQSLETESNPNVRKEAAIALGNLKDKSARESLITAIQTDNECQVRWAAISALSKINGDAETKQLIRDLTDELVNIIQKEKDEVKLSAAAKILGEIGNIAAAKTLYKTMKVSKELVRLEINLALDKMAKRFNYPSIDEFINLLK
jgi:HEAT repeat protein